MKFTRKQVIELNHVLATTEYEMPISSRFRYAVTHNLKKTKEEIDAINDAFPQPEGLKQFIDARNAVLTKYKVAKNEDADKLESEVKKALDAELEALVAEHKEALDEADAVEKEKMAFLDEEVELDVKTVKLAEVPTIAPNNKYPHWDIWQIIERIIVE